MVTAAPVMLHKEEDVALERPELRFWRCPSGDMGGGEVRAAHSKHRKSSRETREVSLTWGSSAAKTEGRVRFSLPLVIHVYFLKLTEKSSSQKKCPGEDRGLSSRGEHRLYEPLNSQTHPTQKVGRHDTYL